MIPKIGMYCGGSASVQLSEMQTYCNLDHLPIGQAYFDSTQSWASGMWSTFYPQVIATADDGILAVPMPGVQPVAHTSAQITAGTPITSIPITALAAAGGITTGTLIPSGTPIILYLGNTPEYATTSAAVSVGATSIPITSWTPAHTFASGNGLKPLMTISPQAPTDTTGAGNAPTPMTLASITAGTWDSHYTKCAQAAANRPNAIIRLLWEAYGNGWYPWNGEGAAAQYVAAFQHLVTLFRAVSSSFRFTWDGATTLDGYTPWTDGGYPGDAYCDYWSADLYDDGRAYNALQSGVDQAAAHGKLYIVPEFGFWPVASGGGGDDPTWIQAVFDWVMAQGSSKIYAALFFDSPVGKLDASQYPNGGPLTASLIEQYANQNFAEAAGAANPRYVSIGGARYRRAS